MNTRHGFFLYLLLVLVSALVLAFYYGLTLQALNQELARSAIVDHEQIISGFRWDFAADDDLVGEKPTGFPDYRLTNQTLQISQGTGSGFLSLNLRGDKIDSQLFRRLWLRMRSDVATQLTVYFRERHDGTVYRMAPTEINPGWQILKIDLSGSNWTTNDGAPARWGGASESVASLRLHPVSQGTASVDIDWISLLPSADRAEGPKQRPRLPLLPPYLPAAQDPRDVVYELQMPYPTTARVMALREQLEHQRPASSVLIGQPFPLLVAPYWAWLLFIGALLVTVLSPLVGGVYAAVFQLLGLIGLGALALTALGEFVSDGLVSLALLSILVWLVVEYRPRGLLYPAGRWPAWRDALLLLILLGAPAFVFSGEPILVLKRWLIYLPWAALQQSFLIGAVFGLLMQITGNRQKPALYLSAILFGLAHYPNFELMVATALLGALVLAHFGRHRSLVPLVVLHATLGALYLTLGPASLIYSGAVGVRYWQ